MEAPEIVVDDDAWYAKVRRTGREPQGPGRRQEESLSGVRKLRLLVVDDDETMRIVCRRFFTRQASLAGIAIDEAASGEAAIELLRDQDYDCVLSDFRMGAVSGIDVLAYALRERPRTIRILLTGFAAPAIQQQAVVKARVHEFIEKPMTTAGLEALLRERVVEAFLEPMLNQA